MVKKILVSQPQPTSDRSPYYDIAREYEVELVFRPFIKVEGITAKEFRQQKVNIALHTAVVFTSRHAIDNFFTLAKELRVTIPETLKYFCVTEQISLYIQKYVQYRKRKVFFGTTGKIDDLLPLMLKHKTERFLIPLSDVHNSNFATMLADKGMQFTECVMYRTVSNDLTPEEIASFDYDMMIFFSPIGIKSLMKNFPSFKQGKIKIAAFGAATAAEAKANNLKLAIEAPTKEYPSMTGALKAYLEKSKKHKR